MLPYSESTTSMEALVIKLTRCVDQLEQFPVPLPRKDSTAKTSSLSQLGGSNWSIGTSGKDSKTEASSQTEPGDSNGSIETSENAFKSIKGKGSKKKPGGSKGTSSNAIKSSKGKPLVNLKESNENYIHGISLSHLAFPYHAPSGLCLC